MKDNIATGKFSSAELSEQGKDGVELEIGLPGTNPVYRGVYPGKSDWLVLPINWSSTE